MQKVALPSGTTQFIGIIAEASSIFVDSRLQIQCNFGSISLVLNGDGLADSPRPAFKLSQATPVKQGSCGDRVQRDIIAERQLRRDPVCSVYSVVHIKIDH